MRRANLAERIGGGTVKNSIVAFSPETAVLKGQAIQRISCTFGVAEVRQILAENHSIGFDG